MQNIPVELALSQSTDPQRQPALPSFADVPSVILQDAAGREQVLDAAVQTMPVPFPLPLLVQAVLPHMHGILISSRLLGAEPSVILQAGAVMVHRQTREDVQETVHANDEGGSNFLKLRPEPRPSLPVSE